MSRTMSIAFAQLCADRAAAGLAAYLDGLNVRYRVERDDRPADFEITFVEATFTVPDVPKVIAIPELLDLYINPVIEALGLRVLEDLEKLRSTVVLTYENSSPSLGIYRDSAAGPVTVRARINSTWIDTFARAATIELAYEVAPVWP